MPPASIDQLLETGVVLQLMPGQAPPSWGSPPLVIVDGLLRLTSRTPEGREWTLRYAEPGETVHFAHMGERDTGLRVEALCLSLVLAIDRGAVLRRMETDAQLASAVARAGAAELQAMVAEITGTALRPLRTRICNHLLFLAQHWPEHHGRLALTHHDLASAVGSVRDVVTRILEDLQSAGALELRRSAIVVLDAGRLRTLRDDRNDGRAVSAAKAGASLG